MMRCLFVLLLIASPLYAAEKLLPRPTDDEIIKVENEIQLIYNSDIKTAKTSEQKAKLAKEILGVALETSGPERFRLCQLARQIAVAGNDIATAFAASTAIAEYFEPDIIDADDQFEEGQALWRKAEKAKGEARLRKQAEAVEWYCYARTSAQGLKKKIIEKRLEIEDNGGKEKNIQQPTIVYLDDVQESELVIGYGSKFGKHGSANDNPDVTTKRIHSLVFYPPNNGCARIVYQLDQIGRNFTTFKTHATLDTNPVTPITFKVFGDGKLLWKSNTLPKSGSEQCDIAIVKIKILELQVECPGTNNNANVAWVDPCIMTGARPKK